MLRFLQNLKDRYSDYAKLLKQVNANKEAEKAAHAHEQLAESAQRAANAITDIGLDVSQLAASAVPEAQRFANSIYEPLDRIADRIAHISELKIDRSKFEPLVELFKSSPEALDLTKAFDQLWNILDQKVKDNTAPQQIMLLVSALAQAAQASRDLHDAQTPLGRATAEYNHLLDQQRDLNDPLLQQKEMEIELLRQGIDLKLRDFNATVSLAQSQAELGGQVHLSRDSGQCSSRRIHGAHQGRH
jgi:hypothetical protein